MRRSQVVRMEQAYLTGQRLINFTGRHRFDDRRRHSETLVVILAGYKPYLWDLSLARLARFLPGDVDVCVASPGIVHNELADWATSHSFSYLATSGNYPSLAQNLAIRHHPRARYVLKVDEDVFVAEGFVEGLLATYRHVEQDARHWPGFVAPLLNVNGYSYRPFLEAIGAAEDYRERFGELMQAAGPIRATEDGEAARWIWERSLPFDEVAARVRAGGTGYSTVPHKFSIGAILFERAFWERFGGFKVRPFVGGIGVDEAHICAACTTFSRVMAVSHGTLAGHYSFAPQEEIMRRALPALRERLALDDVVAEPR